MLTYRLRSSFIVWGDVSRVEYSDEERVLRKSLESLIKSREQLLTTYNKLKNDVSAHANSYYSIDAKRTNRQVLQRLCEEIQTSGLVTDHTFPVAHTTSTQSNTQPLKPQASNSSAIPVVNPNASNPSNDSNSAVISKCLMGLELAKWLLTQSVVNSEREVGLIMDLLLRTGLIDLIPPPGSKPILPNPMDSTSPLKTRSTAVSAHAMAAFSAKQIESEATTVLGYGLSKYQPEYFRFRVSFRRRYHRRCHPR